MTNILINNQDHSNNPLWLYSLKQYKDPECAKFLINAQDQYHLDINILLYLAFMAHKKCTVNMPILMNGHAMTWQREVVQPIRALRRRIKHFDNRAWYKDIKALELNAEKYEQILLFAQTKHANSNSLTFEQNLKLSCRSYFEHIQRELNQEWLQLLTEYLQPKCSG